LGSFSINYGNRGEEKRPILLASFGEEGPYAHIGPLSLAGSAEHFGVNQVHDQGHQAKTSAATPS
jgi:hypothetical protein